METPCITRRRGRRRAWRATSWAFMVGVWAVWGAGEVAAAPHPRADSPEEPDLPTLRAPLRTSVPSSGNALGMLLLGRRQPIVLVAGGRGSTAEDIMRHYIPVIMAEMDAPVSTRDPSIIRVTGCRQGFNEDRLGACRQVFVPRTYLPRSSTRPNRQTSIASLLPIRPRPRIPRPQPQTQRDLIRQFNRGRPSWFGRSLPSPTKINGITEPSGKALLEVKDGDSGDTTATTTTTSTTTTPRTTTECDD